MYTVMLLVFIFGAALGQRHLPNQERYCPQNDNGCKQRSANNSFRTLAANNLDPLQTLCGGPSVTGMKDCTISYVNLNVENLSFDWQLSCPRLVIRSNHFNSVPYFQNADGNGFDDEFRNIVLEFHGTLKKVGDYIQIVHYTVHDKRETVQIQDGTQSNFVNQLNRIFFNNDNNSEMNPIFKTYILVTNSFFSSRPVNMLFPVSKNVNELFG